MKSNYQKTWWILTINGVLAILFGALTFIDSEAVMKSLSVYVGLLLLLGGILLLFGAMDQKKKQKDYKMMLFGGGTLAVIGIIVMVFPLQTLKFFLIIIGIWAFLIGILKIYIAVSVGKALEYRHMLLLGGLIFSGIGLLVLVDPTWLAGFILKIFGAVSIVLGMMMVYFSFALKRIK